MRAVALGVMVTCLCLTGAASGQTVSKADCIDAHVAAQEHKNQSQLVAAKKQLITCAHDSCPATIRSECASLLEQVEAGIPTIVIKAQDGAGNDVSDVRVTLDGNPLVETLDGKPLAIDPGAHQLRFERAGSPPVEQEVIAQAGVKYRAVEVRFAAAGDDGSATDGATDPAAPSPDDSAAPADASGISPWVYVGFAVAGVGAVVGGITGGISLSQASDLKDQCPNDGCTQDKSEDIDSMMALGHVSTASFIIGGVGAGVAVVALLVGGSDESESGSMQPMVGPGYLGMRGSF